MKKINFVRTVTPLQQRTINRWFWHMFTVTSMALLAIIAIQTHQIISFIQIRKQKEEVGTKAHHTSSFAQKQSTLHKKKELLAHHIQTIKQWSAQKNPGTEIYQLITALNKNGTLVACSRNDKKCDLTLALNDATNLTPVMHSIKNLSFVEDVKLSSLSHQNNRTEVKLQALTK